MNAVRLLGTAMGLGFVSGLRLYSAVLTLGLGIRLHLIHLNPSLAGLGICAHPTVLAVAATGFALEFFADKVSWVDSLWDSIHTVIRPLGAALLASAALGKMDLNPAAQLIVILLAGGVAFASHSSKAATRLAANHSPEPFSNIALSLAGDAFVPAGTWITLKHPLFILGLVLGFMAIFLMLAPGVLRSMRLECVALLSMARQFAGTRTNDARLPDDYRARVLSTAESAPPSIWVRCAAGQGVSGLHRSIGYLGQVGDNLFFVTRRWFHFREHRFHLGDLRESEFHKGLLLDRLWFTDGTRRISFDVFKDASGYVEAMVGKIEAARLEPGRPVVSIDPARETV